MYDYIDYFIWKFDDKKDFVMFVAKERIKQLWNERDRFINRLHNTQKSQIRNHDKKITFKTYRLKKHMIFFIKILKNVKFKKKLFYKFTKIFEIIDVIDIQTYRFRLSKKWKIYSIFHVFLLKSYYQNVNTTKFENIIFVDENEKYEIEIILNNIIKWKKSYYLIKWKDLFSCENNWISKMCLINTQSMLKKYHKRQKSEIITSKTKKFRLRVRKRNSQLNKNVLFENENL